MTVTKITTPGYTDQSVTTDKLANDSVTTDKLDNGAVTNEKLNINYLNLNTTGIGEGDIGSNGGTDGIFGIYNTTNDGNITLNLKNNSGVYNDILTSTSSLVTVKGDLSVIGNINSPQTAKAWATLGYQLVNNQYVSVIKQSYNISSATLNIVSSSGVAGGIIVYYTVTMSKPLSPGYCVVVTGDVTSASGFPTLFVYGPTSRRGREDLVQTSTSFTIGLGNNSFSYALNDHVSVVVFG